MATFRSAKESTYMWSAIMILLGVVLILLGEFLDIDSIIKDILQFVGITLLSVFAVSLIYQRFIAEKQFEDFKKLLSYELKEMESIQSKCMKLGINEIFETRNAYEAKYPLLSIVEQSPANSKIICVARSLFHLLNKTGELKKGLERGLTFEFACVDPNEVNPLLERVFLLRKSDIDSALMELRDLLIWATRERVKGSLEIKYHRANTLDSVFIFTSGDGEEKLVWDLTFGRDLTQKKVVILSTHDNSLGKDLKNRFIAVWQDANTQVHYSNGEIINNNLGWQFNGNSI